MPTRAGGRRPRGTTLGLQRGRAGRYELCTSIATSPTDAEKDPARHDRWMDDTIARLLRYDTWAVVGLTPNPVRAAYGVARFLLARGKTVIPVNPTGEAVHGQPAVTHLSEIDVPVDVVDIFRRADQAG